MLNTQIEAERELRETLRIARTAVDAACGQAVSKLGEIHSGAPRTIIFNSFFLPQSIASTAVHFPVKRYFLLPSSNVYFRVITLVLVLQAAEETKAILPTIREKLQEIAVIVPKEEYYR